MKAEVVLSGIQLFWRMMLRDAAKDYVEKTDNKFDDSLVRLLDILLNDAE